MHLETQKKPEFFGIEPGNDSVEALRGGWYTKLLVPYLGSEGKLVGANYAMGMWSLDTKASVWIT